MTLATDFVSVILSQAKTRPDAPALQFVSRQWNYRELADACAAYSRRFKDGGLREGDRLALWMTNQPEYVFAYLGAIMAGLVPVPINPALAPPEVAHILTQSGSSGLVAGSRKDQIDRLPTEAMKSLKLVEIASDIVRQESVHPSESERGTAFAGSSSRTVAHIIFTSGTTGSPKGAAISVDSVSWMVGALADYFKEDSRDIVLCALPVYHAYAMLQCLLTPLSVGAKVVLLPNFDAIEVLDVIEKQGVTIFFGVPAMFTLMCQRANLTQRHLKTLRLAVSGGAALSEQVLHEFLNATGVEICEGYGLSEATCMSLCNPPTAVRKIGSIGTPVPGLEAALKDEYGQFIGGTGIGELVVRGPTVMQGYWSNDRATAEAIVDGWLHTGDICRRDDDGYYFVVDRRKDMYIRGGYNVYPREVEAVISKHPSVLESAVIGIPNPVLGEDGCAFVILRDGAKPDVRALIEHCKEQLAQYKVPAAIEFVTQLPRTATGKVLKRELVAMQKNSMKNNGAPNTHV